MEHGGKPMSLMMLDIDYFKQVNDTHGHAAGDSVLRELVGRISYNLRSFDTVARFGGEEFVVVMPDTNVTIACVVAERLRVDIEGHGFSINGAADQMTISIGVAAALEAGDNLMALLKRADDALYHAKNVERNRAVLYADDNFEIIIEPPREKAANGG